MSRVEKSFTRRKFVFISLIDFFFRFYFFVLYETYTMRMRRPKKYSLHFNALNESQNRDKYTKFKIKINVQKKRHETKRQQNKVTK